jgi:ABC-2 type transport system permease protein
MHKIGLIIAREYISRVKKKSFVIMTLLGPLLFGGLMIVPIWLASQEGDHKLIQVIDQSGVFEGKLENTESISYQFIQSDLEESKKILNEAEEISAILFIPKIDINDPKGIKYYSTQNPGIGMVPSLERKLKKVVEDIKLLNSGLDQEVIAGLKANLNIQTINLNEAGDESESSAGAAFGVGYISSFLLYMFIFIYGAQIMRGIIEEKTSRVIEVMIASVKPFHLMMGKILGIAGVGLTQFLLWVILSTGIMTLVTSAVIDTPDQSQIEQALEKSNEMSPVPKDMEQQKMLVSSMEALSQINIPLIIGCFVFYFLAGYLFYGSLFAAVGSAVDSDADSQQFMLPITLPMIFSMVMISVVIKEPHGAMAFWLSVAPFTSPVIMMMRLPFDVPTWEIALSMISLIAGFCGTTWIASRIYRIGIFMHGTKVNFKTLAKWFVMKV